MLPRLHRGAGRDAPTAAPRGTRSCCSRTSSRATSATIFPGVRLQGRLRLPRHAQLRPRDRRGRGRGSPPDDPAGAAPARARQRRAPRGRRRADAGLAREARPRAQARPRARRLPRRRAAQRRRPDAARRARRAARAARRAVHAAGRARRCATPTTSSRSIRERDVLLHHPYESFDTVVELISRAADDPDVLAIKQTLYRAGGDSPIVKALARAAETRQAGHGDRRAQGALRRGVEHPVGAHARAERRPRRLRPPRPEDARQVPRSSSAARSGKLRRYVHLSTGNYNPTTARLYTDLGALHARSRASARTRRRSSTCSRATARRRSGTRSSSRRSACTRRCSASSRARRSTRARAGRRASSRR